MLNFLFRWFKKHEDEETVNCEEPSQPARKNVCAVVEVDRYLVEYVRQKREAEIKAQAEAAKTA